MPSNSFESRGKAAEGGSRIALVRGCPPSDGYTWVAGKLSQQTVGMPLHTFIFLYEKMVHASQWDNPTFIWVR